MNAQRWKKIEQIYNSALELEPERREAFLEQACAGDKSLRKEVQQLLERQSEAEDFIESPAIEKLAHGMADDSPSMNGSPSMVGKLIGRYRVDKQIGAGGMGEVYQAKDQKLGRDVAIKILPKEFAEDSDRVRRFEREAKLLASLNHPNIAVLYELEEYEGTQFLVLELIEGETLSERLQRGSISLEESLKLALQIGEALEAAHEKGVIHRDLKPANIKVTPDGKVKVLDFGLAKAFAADQGNLDLSDSQTLSETSTQKGLILGTAPYMSPEQAQGQPVGKQTDIWAFGCVLYEMLTGKSAFSGKNITDILAAVMRAEPEWSSLPANLHWRLREVLERCLKKELKDRYHDISDVRVDIQKVLADPSGVFSGSIPPAALKTRQQTALPWIVAIIGIIIAAIAVWKLKPTEPRQVTRFDYDLPEGQQFNFDPKTPSHILAVSPDGNQIVYSTNMGLYRRSLEEGDAVPIKGTDGNAQSSFFSPDGQWVGYWCPTDKKLKRIGIHGGAPKDLCDAAWVVGAIWYPDDIIVYSDIDRGIMRVSANGGNPEVLEKESFTGSHPKPLTDPQLLPDGKSLIFTKHINEALKKIILGSRESEKRQELFPGEAARYLPTGHIVYWIDHNLRAVPFDLKKLKTTGSSIRILEGVGQYSISDSGTLAYLAPKETANPYIRSLVWVNQKGEEASLELPPDLYRYLRISPDGNKVAFGRAEGVGDKQNMNIYIWDLVNKDLKQITFDESDDAGPIWTPDGKRIIFWSRRDNQGIYWKRADGSGKTEKLFPFPEGLLFLSSLSSDGKVLLGAKMILGGYSNQDIVVLSMDGEHKLKPLLHEKYLETHPRISPDGRWMAYTSNKSGKNEIYVRPFPDVNGGGQWKVSKDGGRCPLWSPDGTELFYLNGDAVMAVSVNTEETFDPRKPRTLFRSTYIASYRENEGVPWDISPDGKRFLMIAPPPAQSKTPTEARPNKINIILNWFEELKKKVPAR